MVSLIGYGLMKRLRLEWIAAFVWQGVEAGFGLITLTLNDYALGGYTQLTGIPFYGIVLPLMVATVSFVLLLIPATQNWVRQD